MRVKSWMLFLAGLSISGVQAEPMDISVSGYFNTALLMQDFEAHPETPDFALEQDGEIHFKGKRVLENGIRLGVQVQLEADQNIDQIDEHYLFLQGDFGRVILGAENSAADLLLQGGNTYLGYRATRDEFLVNLNTTGYRKTDHSFVTGDAPKLTYISPRIGGLRAGLSFTPSTQSITGSRFGIEPSGDGAGDHALSFGLNYKGTFDGTTFGVSLGGEHAAEGGTGISGDGTFKDRSIAANAKTGKIELGLTALTRQASQWGATPDYEKRFTNLALTYRISPKITLGLDRQDDEIVSGALRGDGYQHNRIGGTLVLAERLRVTFSFLDGEQQTAGQVFGTQIGAAGLLLRF